MAQLTNAEKLDYEDLNAVVEYEKAAFYAMRRIIQRGTINGGNTGPAVTKANEIKTTGLAIRNYRDSLAAPGADQNPDEL